MSPVYQWDAIEDIFVERVMENKPNSTPTRYAICAKGNPFIATLASPSLLFWRKKFLIAASPVSSDVLVMLADLVAVSNQKRQAGCATVSQTVIHVQTAVASA